MKKAMTLTVLAAASLLAMPALAQDKPRPPRRPCRISPTPWGSAKR